MCHWFQGLSDIASGGDKDESYYQLLNMSEPQTLAVKQDTEENVLDMCAELNRLQQAWVAPINCYLHE